MPRTETVWPNRRAEGRPAATFPPHRSTPFNPAASRAEAGDILRELAFVFHAARAVRQSMTERDAL